MNERQTINAVGFLESALLKLLARSVEVTAVEAIGERFRIVRFAGADLERRAWAPGDIV